MAHTYTEAINSVRKLEEVRVYSPTPANREKFAERFRSSLECALCHVTPRKRHLPTWIMVATCTDSRIPVYESEMLKLHRPGTFPGPVPSDEMDDATFQAVDKIFVNATEGYTDLILGSEQDRARRPTNKEYRRRYNPTSYPKLAKVISGEVPGRERILKLSSTTYNHLACSSPRSVGLSTSGPKLQVLDQNPDGVVFTEHQKLKLVIIFPTRLLVFSAADCY